MYASHVSNARAQGGIVGQRHDKRVGCKTQLTCYVRGPAEALHSKSRVSPRVAQIRKVVPKQHRTTVIRTSATVNTSQSQDLCFDVRDDFAILDQKTRNDNQLVYLDSAATSQKPKQVLSVLDDYYTRINSNVHRGVHTLSAQATTAYEAARAKIAKFINAEAWNEIVFTRNATEAINLVAYSWGMKNLKEGDEVIISVMEHHSNIVPWQIVAEQTGAVLRFVKLSPEGMLDMDHYRSLLSPRVKLVSVAHVSNTLGCTNPVAEMAELAHEQGALMLVDACQSVPHMPVDVKALGADWIVASGHKMCAPTGIGFLWGRYKVLDSMGPFMGGGEMIATVYQESSTYASPPSRFEAGTPAIGEAIALGAAVDYLEDLGMDKVHAWEEELGRYLYEKLAAVEGLTIHGPSPDAPGGRAALCSFSVKGVHPTDLSTILDESGIAVRSGHHCTQVLHRELGVDSTCRASLYIYNTKAEVDFFVEKLKETVEFFSMF